MSNIFKIQGVNGIPVPNGDNTVEVGYIILPTGIERDDFVKTCQKNLRMSVVIERNGSVIHNCMTTEQIFQYLKIPQTPKEVGTPVLLLKTVYNEKPIIIATLPETNSNVIFEENVHFNTVSDENGSFTIKASLINGTYLLNIEGTGERKLKINVNGEEGGGIELNTNGNKTEVVNGVVSVKSFQQINAEIVDVENEKTTSVTLTPTETNITSSEKISIGVVDPESGTTSQITIDKDNIVLDPNTKMSVKSGAQPIPLGNTLKSILEKINDNINTLKQALSDGSSGVTPAANGSPSGGGGTAFAAAVTTASTIQPPDLSKLNSEISFTD